jgi:carbonic anhydrase
MNRRGLLGALGGLALCPLCARSGSAAAPGSLDWAWSGDRGPENWGKLTNFGTCGTGSQQSPIDLAGAIKAELPRLDMAWTRVTAEIVNPGYTIRVNMPPGNRLRVGTLVYEMVEFHFHAPSEHAVRGKRQAAGDGGAFRPQAGHAG